jgi:hypothetical protein
MIQDQYKFKVGGSWFGVTLLSCDGLRGKAKELSEG